MVTSPSSVMVKNTWRGREDTRNVTAMQDRTRVILLFLFFSFSCLLASEEKQVLTSRKVKIYRQTARCFYTFVFVIITWEWTTGRTMRGRRYWMRRMRMVKAFFM